MKKHSIIIGSIFLIAAIAVSAPYLKEQPTRIEGTHYPHQKQPPVSGRFPDKGCVFKTVFGEEQLDSTDYQIKTVTEVDLSVNRGLKWLSKAQLPNGGWGAGSHSFQTNMDPHSVQADPATTAMVSMAMLRCGSTPYSGEYASNVSKAVEFLLQAVENSGNREKITQLENTQIQAKLGSNIDVVLTAQFFTNLLDALKQETPLKKRVVKSLEQCIQKIQRQQNADGSYKGGGWAGVLQDGLAHSAIESAQYYGIAVDSTAFEQSKNYQKGNLNTETGDVNVDRGAGIVLYSISNTTRASSKDARKAKEMIDEGKKKGILEKDAEVTVENLEKVGLAPTLAYDYQQANKIYEQGKVTAQNENVMSGFGNNGGEEFLSYLQTGESMIVAKDNDWKKWYDNMTSRLLKIQNNDGTWNGHHCITSPVFCTATCVLLLSINNDVDQLMKLGSSN
ncbi:MAG: hypothetical protein SFW35_09525 [Chitinophagales bacterium]|nr:hypothetical protein [Chitinophagales bacterium]